MDKQRVWEWCSLVLEFLWLLVTLLWMTLVAMYKALVPVKLQMKKNLSGQTVLVTGSGNGIGRLLSVKMAELGCNLVLWDVNEAGNLETARQIKATGANVTTFTVDLSDRDAVYSNADKVKADVGEVDILVNNAGIVTGNKFLDCADSLVAKNMEVNANAHFWTTKSFLPSMLQRNKGHVVAIASAAGLFGGPTLADYCASKFAAVGFTESLRAEISKTGKTGVQTTLVCPYFIKTGMFEGAKTRFPGILDLLEPGYVAEKIVEAILTNQEMLLMPRMLYLFYYFRGVLPTYVREKVEDFMGVNECMDEFTGRS